MKKIVLTTRNLIVTVLAYSVGFLVTVLGLVIALLALIFRARFVPPVLAFFWSRILFFLVGRPVKVMGRENIAEGKSYLVIANHSSFFDIPGIMVVMPDIIWVGREKLFRIPLFGTFLKFWGSIPIDTKSVMRSGNALSAAVHQAKKARSVAIFPEGTRTRDGRLQDFKRGFTRILRNSDLDVLPLTLNGFYTLCPKGRTLFDPSQPLEIVVHRPVSRENLLDKDDREIAEIVRGMVASAHKGR